MAVQAQYPSTIPVADFRMRARQIIAANGGKNPFPYMVAGAAPPFEDVQFQLAPGVVSQITHMNSIGATAAQVQQTNAQAQFTDEFVCGIAGSNKRQRQSEFIPSHQHHLQHQQQHHQQQQQQQQHQHQQQQQQSQPPPQHIVHDFHHRPPVSTIPVVSAAPNTATGVSTGLRLAFPDDRLSSTAPSGCGKLELNSSTGAFPLLMEEIAIELQRQKDEMEQLMRAQEEQMRRSIEEKQQQQSRALLHSVERFVARRLRDKELEMEKTSRRNMELEERVKQLTVETRLWQNKAKSGELMVASLRSNLQAAVALSREHSREGVGDTDADDAESSHPDDAADEHARTYKENKELKEKRTCRVCRSNDVCILLLPCRHLCLCKECEARLDTCPLCRHSKNASVQVYMS